MYTLCREEADLRSGTGRYGWHSANGYVSAFTFTQRAAREVIPLAGGARIVRALASNDGALIRRRLVSAMRGPLLARDSL